MMTVIPSRGGNCYLGVHDQLCRKAFNNKVLHSGDFFPSFPSRRLIFSSDQSVTTSNRQTARKFKPLLASTLDAPDADDSEDGGENTSENGSENKNPLKKEEDLEVNNSKLVRENLERMVGRDDSSFSGRELATLIRNKFGRSYDVQFIKKEFMGRNLLALNVMWKYMEQRSFPLTEEEYLLRLDDVANTLKCWGAVSHIRNSLANLRAKERPRIGKAVSIFIDMDESGGRSNEWIYK